MLEMVNLRVVGNLKLSGARSSTSVLPVPSEIDNALRVVGGRFEFLVVNCCAVLPLFATNVPPARTNRPGHSARLTCGIGKPHTFSRSDAIDRHSCNGLWRPHVFWSVSRLQWPCRSYVVLVATGLFSF